MTGLFHGKIQGACGFVSANFLFRVDGKFVAFLASSGISQISNVCRFNKMLTKTVQDSNITFDVDMLKLSSYSEGIVNHVTRSL